MWLARVEGEFAWDTGHSIFKPGDLEVGYDAEIIPSEDARTVLGVDVARSKDGDTNTVYENLGGILRFVDEWNDPNAMNTARKVHQYAMEKGATEVRIDGAGLGGPIADAIREFSSGKYEVVEILGGNASPDRNRWYNFRAWSFWSFQDRLSKGLISLDINDDQLADELLGMEKKDRRSGVNSLLLESKDDMRSRGVSSPNRADAANYALVDLEDYFNDPLRDLKRGDHVVMDPYDMLELEFSQGAPM